MPCQAAQTFAHLTDPHLPLLGADLRTWGALNGKRATGTLSWWAKRRRVHRREVSDALLADVHAHQPDQVLVTGDIVNISLPAEFARASAWLHTVGAPRDVMVVPGNHDAYVPVDWPEGLGRWAPYCAGDDGTGATACDIAFPVVRVRGRVAFVGVSTAVPLLAFSAAGRVGPDQLARLEATLADLGARGLFRVVLMHHPPGRAGASARRGLIDREPFARVIARAGAELIVHGHTHRAVLDSLPGPREPVTVLAPGSASSAHHERASWHLVSLSAGDADGLWRADIEVRGLDAQTLRPLSLGRFTLAPAALNTAWSS